jgi:predicted DNA-binding transcriptional regulator YafY
MRKQNRTLKPHERQNLILEQLRLGGSQSVTEIKLALKERHGLDFDRKMIDRDLLAMSSSFGLTDDEGHPKRYSLASDSERRKVEVRVSEEHLQVLSMALMSLKTFKSLRSLALRTEEALATALPEDLKRRLIDHRHSWILQPPPGGIRKEQSSENIEVLLQAIRAGVAVSGTYGSKSSKNTARNLAPLRVEISGNGISLLARDLETPEQEIKRFVPSRFSRLKINSEQKVNQPTPKDLEPFWSTFGGFGGPHQKPVSIRFIVGPSVGEHLKEVEYHPSQRMKPMGQDKYQVTIKVPIGWPIVRLIASFGGDVAAIHPPELRTWVQDIWNGGRLSK